MAITLSDYDQFVLKKFLQQGLTSSGQVVDKLIDMLLSNQILTGWTITGVISIRRKCFLILQLCSWQSKVRLMSGPADSDTVSHTALLGNVYTSSGLQCMCE